MTLAAMSLQLPQGALVLRFLYDLKLSFEEVLNFFWHFLRFN
jgi:hypothetical protein